MVRSMEYIYEVYRERSFTRAARNLYVTQPCLSALVKKTEQKLGFPIFDRSINPLELTEYGKEYIRYIERTMALETEFENYLNDVRGLKTGHLSIEQCLCLSGTAAGHQQLQPPLSRGGGSAD